MAIEILATQVADNIGKSLKIYVLRSFDTCRKAVRALRESGKYPEILDIRVDGIPATDLVKFHEKFGDALVNRRSTTWQNLSQKERNTDPMTLLASYPTLMKRPVIEDDGTLYLGWSAEVRTALLG